MFTLTVIILAAGTMLLLALFMAWFASGLPAALFYRPFLRWWGVGFLLLTAAGFLVSVVPSRGRRPGSA